MKTCDQMKAGGTSLQEAGQRASGLGAHTAAPNRLPTPAVTGSLTNRGRGARPIGGAG